MATRQRDSEFLKKASQQLKLRVFLLFLFKFETVFYAHFNTLSHPQMIKLHNIKFFLYKFKSGRKEFLVIDNFFYIYLYIFING